MQSIYQYDVGQIVKIGFSETSLVFSDKTSKSNNIKIYNFEIIYRFFDNAFGSKYIISIDKNFQNDDNYFWILNETKLIDKACIANPIEALSEIDQKFHGKLVKSICESVIIGVSETEVPPTLKKFSKPARCIVCRNFNEYAEPNAKLPEENTFLCYTDNTYCNRLKFGIE